MSAAANLPLKKSAWAPLAYSLFRWLWIASVASNIGTWMQNVGAAWLMTTLSASPLYVALVQTATNLPVFLLGVPAGAIADIVDRRKLLLVSQAWMLAAAGLLGFLCLAHKETPSWLLFLTFALGLGAAMNSPAWQAIVPELVPRSQLPDAITINSVGFNLARAVGPALGGFVIAATSPAIAFFLNALSFVGVIVVLYLWRRTPRESTTDQERVASAMLAGIRYVRYAPPLHSVLLHCAVFVAGASALWSVLPSITSLELHGGSSAYGALLACLGIGSIAGAWVLTRLRARTSADVIVAAGSLVFGGSSLALFWLSNFWIVCVLMLAAGVAWMLVMSSFNTSAQIALPAWVRARALAVYLLVFQGMMALGSVIWGEVANRIGLRSAMLAAGCVLVGGAFLTYRFRLAQSGDADFSPAVQRPDERLMMQAKPEQGPVLVTVEYRIEPAQEAEFRQAMREVERIRRRDGAIRWGLYEDTAEPGRFLESFLVESWAEHLRQHARATVADRLLKDRAIAFHTRPDQPVVTHWIASEN